MENNEQGSMTIDMKGNILGKQPVDSSALTKEADGLLSVAEAYVVDSPEMRELAYADSTAWKRKKKALEEQCKELCAPLRVVEAGIRNLFRTPIMKLDTAIAAVDKAILDFDAKERKRIADEQARLQAEARKERERLEAEAAAERERALEAERKAAEEAERIRVAAEERRKAEEEEQKRLKLVAEQAARDGDLEESRKIEEAARQKQIEADALARQEAERLAEIERVAAEESARAVQEAAAKAHEAAVHTAAVVIKTDNTGSRARWKGECYDKLALIKFVASNPAFEGLLKVDEAALNALAKAQKQGMAVNGCKAYQEHAIAAARS